MHFLVDYLICGPHVRYIETDNTRFNTMTKEYEIYLETDYGLDGHTIEATNARSMLTKLKAIVDKEDIGADAWYIHPTTGEEVGIKW